MEKPIICPNCGSIDVEMNNYAEIDYIHCNSCNYDDRYQYKQTHGEKLGQNRKKPIIPYKT